MRVSARRVQNRDVPRPGPYKWAVDVELEGIIFTTEVDDESIALRVVMATAKALGVAGESV